MRYPIFLCFLMLWLSCGASAQPDLYLPPRSVGKAFPTVVVLNGEKGTGPLFGKMGLACVLVQPGADAEKAVAWVKENIESRGGDPGQIFLLGQGLEAGLVKRVARNLRGCIVLSPGLAADPLPHLPTLVLLSADDSPLTEGEGKVFPDKSRATLAAGLTRTDDPVQKSLRRFIAAQSPQQSAGLPGVEFIPSPNWDVRSLGGRIDTVVIHSTVINTLKDTVRVFLDDRNRAVSAHYVVDRDGRIVQMVDERFVARHAGVSELEGRTGVNDFSVGVELINLNDGHDPYTDAQYRALAKIIGHLREHWSIPDARIVSHEQIARPVGRKSDPKGFDFARLYRLCKSR